MDFESILNSCFKPTGFGRFEKLIMANLVELKPIEFEGFRKTNFKKSNYPEFSIIKKRI